MKDQVEDYRTKCKVGDMETLPPNIRRRLEDDYKEHVGNQVRVYLDEKGVDFFLQPTRSGPLVRLIKIPTKFFSMIIHPGLHELAKKYYCKIEDSVYEDTLVTELTYSAIVRVKWNLIPPKTLTAYYRPAKGSLSQIYYGSVLKDDKVFLGGSQV